MNFAALLGIVEQVAVSILAGAANSNSSIATFDATHPVVSAASEAGALAAKALGAEGIPAAQLAQSGLAIAQMAAGAIGAAESTVHK